MKFLEARFGVDLPDEVGGYSWHFRRQFHIWQRAGFQDLPVRICGEIPGVLPGSSVWVDFCVTFAKMGFRECFREARRDLPRGFRGQQWLFQVTRHHMDEADLGFIGFMPDERCTEEWREVPGALAIHWAGMAGTPPPKGHTCMDRIGHVQAGDEDGPCVDAGSWGRLGILEHCRQ